MQEDEHNRAERLFETILAPLSKILIKNNISVQSAIEILKRALVRAEADDPQATDSAISLKTGVHRKDVKRLRQELTQGVTKKFPLQGLAIILSTWTNTPAFCDDDGRRRILPRKGTPLSPGFDDLVRASKIDLAPATVLAELSAQDLVRSHEDGGIELTSSTFVAQSGEAALVAFEATVADHIRVAAENVLSPPGAARQFDQVLRYNRLSAQSVDQLEAEARKLAKTYLERLNAMAHRLQAQDGDAGEMANGRFVTGTYIAPSPENDARTSVPLPPPSEQDKST